MKKVCTYETGCNTHTITQSQYQIITILLLTQMSKIHELIYKHTQVYMQYAQEESESETIIIIEKGVKKNRERKKKTKIIMLCY